MYLTDIKMNQKATVVAIDESLIQTEDERIFVNRILELGVTPGSEIQLKHKAPLGDPMMFDINGGLVAISRSHCRFFKVEPS